MIEKVLVICTSHVTLETAQALDQNQHWISTPMGEGWLVTVPAREDATHVPFDLAQCLDLARVNDCRWLLLDRDADEHPDLKTYEW